MFEEAMMQLGPVWKKMYYSANPADKDDLWFLIRSHMDMDDENPHHKCGMHGNVDSAMEACHMHTACKNGDSMHSACCMHGNMEKECMKACHDKKCKDGDTCTMKNGMKCVMEHGKCRMLDDNHKKK
jgi:hypothetical protein